MSASQPQWKPPRELRDPLVRRARVDRATWSREIRGRLPQCTDYGVALMLASYGNRDGTRCRPGTVRLAKDLGYAVRKSPDDPERPPATVKRSLARLAETGWITLGNPGGPSGRGYAQEWHLTIPAPCEAERGRWIDEQDGPQWMERPAITPKRPGVLKGGHHGPPYDAAEGGHHGPPYAAEGGHGGAEGGHGSTGKGVTTDPPPGKYYQGSSIHHFARGGDGAAAAARAAAHRTLLDLDRKITSRLAELNSDRNRTIDEWNRLEFELSYSVTERIEAEFGSPLDEVTARMVDAMLARREHPKFIIRAARKRLAADETPDGHELPGGEEPA